MATAAQLRTRMEAVLSHRIPAAFSLKFKQSPELFASGIAEIDAILEGGVPRGSITEICGPASTGKTSFALSILSGITRSGAACAWVDVHDALCPESAAAAGVVLERLLWLRIRPEKAHRADNTSAPVSRFTISSSPQKLSANYVGNSSHPRNEMRGMDSAVSLLFKGEGGLLRDKTIGTQGKNNRPLSEPRCAEPLSRMQRDEQVAYDRLPARREDYFLQKSTGNQRAQLQAFKSTARKNLHSVSEKPWSRLDQALKAADLLLQAGGFAAIVLDMSDVLSQQALRIPLASWYRFRLAAEQARAALILLTQAPCASSCAALVLRCEAAEVQWSTCGETPLFQHQRNTLVRERNRYERNEKKKPPARADWETQAAWTRVR